MGKAVHLAVAGDVFDGVLFCAVLFPISIDLRVGISRSASVTDDWLFPLFILPFIEKKS